MKLDENQKNIIELKRRLLNIQKNVIQKDLMILEMIENGITPEIKKLIFGIKKEN